MLNVGYYTRGYFYPSIEPSVHDVEPKNHVLLCPFCNYFSTASTHNANILHDLSPVAYD
jgi:hypothetical protein